MNNCIFKPSVKNYFKDSVFVWHFSPKDLHDGQPYIYGSLSGGEKIREFDYLFEQLYVPYSTVFCTEVKKW